MPTITNRKQKIVETALSLFAEKGYDHATTQMIARHAGVSEALIFKHHGSKDNLLDHIVKSGYKRIVFQNRGMLQEAGSLNLIHRIIDLPYQLVEEEPFFWKLQSRIIDIIPDARVQHERFMKPVYSILVKAFTDLNYKAPKQETAYLLMVIEMIWKQLSLDNNEEVIELRDFIKLKYTP